MKLCFFFGKIIYGPGITSINAQLQEKNWGTMKTWQWPLLKHQGHDIAFCRTVIYKYPQFNEDVLFL